MLSSRRTVAFRHRPRRWRRPLVALLIAALLPTTAVFAAAAPAAANAPGSPGSPSAPIALYTEDFENAGASWELVSQYTGAGPLDETYKADPAWLTNCNGSVGSEQALNETPPPNCYGDYGQGLYIAYALGVWNGENPQTNHVLVNYTNADLPANATELATNKPIPLPSANRFLTLGTDVGAHCGSGLPDPLLQFSLLEGSTAVATSSAPINPCTAPQENYQGEMLGRYIGGTAVLDPGASAGFRLVNDQLSGNVNDYALDNVRLLDVTPQLDVTAPAQPTQVGAPAALIYTVTNTSELDAKDGWSFTANLPSGLTPDGTPSSTCSAESATVNAAARSVAVTGDLDQGQSSCEVTVPVTSILGGAYQLCAAQVSGLVGLDAPGCASVAFTAPVFDARAAASNLTVPPLSPVVTAASQYSCTSAPGSDGASSSVGLGLLGSLGAQSTSVQGAIAADGTRTASAHANSTGLSLLGGVITAASISSSAQAEAALTPSGPGPATTSGSVTFGALRVAGVAIAANPGPNSTISVPLVGTVVLNQQVPLAGGAGLTVNALAVTLIDGTRIVLAQSRAALLAAGQPCPAG